MRTKKGISEWTLSKIILKKDILVGFAESRGKVRLRVEGICIFMRWESLRTGLVDWLNKINK